jgi:superfamily II DNA or RNA helicase
VAHDQLEIRVVVEADPTTNQPLASGGYFHAKGGILWDNAGDAVAFSGSVNETATAWRTNYESFHVFCSWRDPEHYQEEQDAFETLWNRGEPGWITVDLPEAIQKELIRLAPVEPPIEDPALGLEVEEDGQSRWLAQYLRDAPYLIHGGWKVGVETAAVDPFPHQRAVAYSVLEQFPCHRLLADEVGLGKTIEAGLIIRSLLLSGWVKRCLILVPRSLAKQWQEELRDRFFVDAPFYDGSRFMYFEHPQNRFEPIPDGVSPWDVHPVTLASAQMVKRPDRMTALLEAGSWDLILLDEAHHARRRDFLNLRRYRPNHLLQLMEKLKEHAKSILLLTATPMQIHPVEVWDLLRLLGLPGGWQDRNKFLSYFVQSTLGFDEIAWDIVLPLLREAVSEWGWNAEWENAARQDLGLVSYQRVKAAVDGTRNTVMNLNDSERSWFIEAMRRHNPVAGLTHRNTRTLLRDYHRRGLLKQHVPNRRPIPRWLDMGNEEEELYHEVEDYISYYFNKYEEVRKGLGFIMTIYRRRLTSSLYALRCSLERRLQFLKGQWNDPEHPAGLEDEDIEEADLSEDKLDEIAQRVAFVGEEISEVERLLEKLATLTIEEKFLRVQQDLSDALRQWDQVLVFTQYTDTLDFLREQMVHAFGSRLGCYSGRGGEVWNGTTNSWVGMSKERIQEVFAKGDIKILLCTDAAAEGLNFQNCGLIFNYDMPWNPMKVEQRIGRVDRIGQRRETVEIRHYFYNDTVEAQIYNVLGDRIGWFETIVGELQPILHSTQRLIQQAAMTSREQRGDVIALGIQELDNEHSELQMRPSPMRYHLEANTPPSASAPVDGKQIEDTIVDRQPWRDTISTTSAPHLFDVANVEGHISLTFRPDALDSAPLDASLCSYGVPLWETLIGLASPISRGDIIRMTGTGTLQEVGYYTWAKGKWESVANLKDLDKRLQQPSKSFEGDMELLRSRFQDEVEKPPRLR